MPTSTARVSTPRADRYVKQLVSHLGHRAGTELGADGVGVVNLPSGGQVMLIPGPDALLLRAAATDAEALATAQRVVASHLVRFATQEELAVDWIDEQEAAAG